MYWDDEYTASPLLFLAEAELRQWVDANPERVNEDNSAVLFTAIFNLKNLPLVE